MENPQEDSVDANILYPPQNKAGRQVLENATDVAITLYAGVFSQGSGQYYFGAYPSWDSFVSQWNQLGSTSNLRLFSTTSSTATSSTTFLGSWLDLGGGYFLWRTPDWSSFITNFNNQKSSTRLLDLDINPSGGNLWYTGTWGSSPIDQTILHDLSWTEFTTQWNTLSSQSWRLKRVCPYASPGTGETLWTGVFEPGSGGYAFFVQPSWSSFLEAYENYGGSSGTLALVDFKVYDEESTKTRKFVGVWLETSDTHQFVYNQDWGTFNNSISNLATQGLYLQKAITYPNEIELPAPQWDQFFAQQLGSQAMGYCYWVLKDGTNVGHGYNKARAPQDSPEKNWDEDTRINLASVSKSVTAVAVLRLLKDHNISVDQPFYPLVQAQFPTVGPGVDTVTIRNLLSMMSGMTIDGTLYTPNIWQFLTTYLQNQNVDQSKRGQVSEYSNTNFTILQAVINCFTGHGGEWPDYYVPYVEQNVLQPMGIDTNIFNAIPDPQNTTATLCYSGSSDPLPGKYWPAIQAIAAGGWISNATQLAKFLEGLRKNTVLDPSTTEEMFLGSLGWYTWDGVYGQYFHHNGGLHTGTNPDQGLSTGIFRLSDGYDCLLLVNSWGFDVISLMAQAFETRAT